MPRAFLGLLAIVALIAAFIAGGSAATKKYQVTGVVKSVDGTTFLVEKSAKDVWEFETSKDAKGAPKVGERVTVRYKMVATEIEPNPAPR